MTRRARAATLIALGVPVLVGLRCGAQHFANPAPHYASKRAAAPLVTPSASSTAPLADEEKSCGSHVRVAIPGRPAMLSCQEARQIIGQVQARLAMPRTRPDAEHFAEALIDWLDPHGLWSAAPDAPIAERVRSTARHLIDEIELAPDAALGCTSARAVGARVASWVDELRRVYSEHREKVHALPAAAAFRLSSARVFQDEPMRPARNLAAELGRRVGIFERSFPRVAPEFARLANERFVPELGAEDWERAVLAAAVRAYVSTIDPHGQWAPLDEEWSLYADDSDLNAGPRLWTHMSRAALGVRIVDGALGPLLRGDLVLSIDGVPTAGLSVEQVEQLSWLDSLADDGARRVRILRSGEMIDRELRVEVPRAANAPNGGLSAQRIRYGDSSVLALDVPEVNDALGEELSRAIGESRRTGPLAGVVLDLRGNGGGSTDGAEAAVGVFLPGYPSFPLLLRGGSVEVEHAAAPVKSDVWAGPVAVLVDGYTASAAEMIAGAIAAYGRGVLLGTRTFGKGCIQEYFDDRVGAGVLRLTTMLFALPDGSPVQGVGLTPALHLPLPTTREREAGLESSLPPWRGPDVRAPVTNSFPIWSPHGGRVGPCADPTVCVALRRLGAGKPTNGSGRAAQANINTLRRLAPR